MTLFFRTSDDALYDSVRLGLDAAWVHVPPVTCITPADKAPRDSLGRIVLAVRQEFADFPAAAAVLPVLLENGSVVEISEAEYRLAVMLPESP
jgi:hypothetical protein